VRDPDSVGTHGSSLSKDIPLRSVPLLDVKLCILRTHPNLIEQLGNTRVRPFCAVLHGTTTLGRTKRLPSLVICSSQFEAVPHVLLPFKT